MRSPLVMASLAVAAVGSYLYISSLQGGGLVQEPTAQAESLTPATGDAELPPSGRRLPAPPARPVAVSRATSGQAGERASDEPGRHRGARDTDDRRNVRSQAAEPAETTAPAAAVDATTADTGLRPAAASQSEGGAAGDQAAGANAGSAASQVQNRWIDDLSGTHARLDMGKGRDDSGCDAADSHCPRPDLPHSVSLAGVVVKTERLVASPGNALDGRLVRGRYIDQTPAVYLK